MTPQARTKGTTEGIQVDMASTLSVILLRRVCILPDKGIRSHLVGTHLRVATLNMADTRRRMAHTLRERILRAGILINLPTHQPVTLVMVHQCPVCPLLYCVFTISLFLFG